MTHEAGTRPPRASRPGARRPATAMTALLVLVGGCGGDPEQPSDPATPPPSGGSATVSPRPEPTLPDPTHHELSLAWDGEEREYRLDEPDSYDPAEPTPLLLVLHGGGGTAASIRNKSQMKRFVQEHGVLVAYPEGINGGWTANPELDQPDDVGFLTALVDHLSDEWNVAPGQVYAAGWSAGAEMSYRLATEAADTFAAVAPIAGNPLAALGEVEPTAPVSVVGFVGLTDEAVQDSVAQWRAMRECEPEPPAVVPGAAHVTRIDATCRDGSEVVEYRIEGAGHVWPKLDTQGFSANDALWEFFTSHTR